MEDDLTVQLKLNLSIYEADPEKTKTNDKVKSGRMKVIAGMELPEETIEEIKEAFLEFDIDSDGTITTQVGVTLTLAKVLKN